MDVRSYTANKIKEYRKLKRMTQKELGEKIGVKHNTVSGYENGTNEPEQDILFKIAAALDVSINDLFPETRSDTTNIRRRKKGVRIPVLGYVVAGIPIEAIEDIIDYEEIDEELARTGDFFALQVRGESMEPVLYEDDVVIIRKQPTADTGDIAIVLINGDEATIKKIKRERDGVMLIGYNTSVYEPHFYNNEEIENLPIQILGKVIELRRKL
jgi:lexA repressor|nr:MAG TPA: Repressor protein CI [Caudoviricetes sp.]